MPWPNPFRRRAAGAAPADEELWFAGDLAECIIDGWRVVPTGVPCTGPLLGKVYTVTAVVARHSNPAIIGLVLHGFDRNAFWHAINFRKVHPGADQLVRAEPEFITLLQRLPQPAKEPVQS